MPRLRLAALAATAVVPLLAGTATSRQFTPAGRYTLVMRVPGDTTPVPATVIITDSAGKFGGTYQRDGSTIVRRIVAVLVQPGPQVVVQIDRDQSFSTILLRVRGAEVSGEAEFDGAVYTLTGTRK